MCPPHIFAEKDLQIARNITIQKQYRDLAFAFMRNHIRFMPLKGIALIDMVYDNFWERFIGDIDLLIHPHDLEKIASVMRKLGYVPIPAEPYGWVPKQTGVPVDLHTRVWYLSSEEHVQLWEIAPIRVICGCPCQVLPREDMVIYTIVHTLVSHGRDVGNWQEDVIRMLTVWKDQIHIPYLVALGRQYGLEIPLSIALEKISMHLPPSIVGRLYPFRKDQHARYRYRLLQRSFNVHHPLKGHLLQVIFQRNSTMKIRSVCALMFPRPYFIKMRYGLCSKPAVIFWYALRPFFLAYHFFSVLFRSVFLTR